MTSIVIGAGLAGLAAAGRLASAGDDVVVLERSDTIGGHASSVTSDGYTFDEGAHVLFTKDEEVLQAVTAGAGEVTSHEAVIMNYHDGSWIPHPVQCNLHALPGPTASECVLSFLEARGDEPIRSYRDWCYASLGREISERFTFPYTRKYWTMEPSELATDWVGERVYRPSREEVIRGALGASESGGHHYITTFSYPREGGYGAFVHGLCDPSVVRTGAQVSHIDWRHRVVSLGDGDALAYDGLVSTMPLPELARVLSEVPPVVAEAATRLECTGVALVDLALATPPKLEAHWFYVYDADMVTSRCSQPHLLSERAVPAGRGSIQAEVYWSERRPLPLPPDELGDRVIHELKTMGVLDGVEVLWSRVRLVDYANVIFDHRRSEAVRTIRRWVEDVAGIRLAGRYGLWEYLWTDGAVRSGWQAADGVLATTTLVNRAP